MKKFFVFIFLLIAFFTPVLAQDSMLKSETGLVKEVFYQDIENDNTKQVATIKILSGQFKGEEIVLDNMLTSNPAYDIILSKGNKVILHQEQNTDIIATVEDVDFFIADIKRDTQIWIFAGIFALLLVLIGRRKGINSIIAIITTVGLIFCVLMPLVLQGICPILCAILVGVLSTIVTIYLVGGFNPKSTSAVVGTSISLVFSGILAIIAIWLAHLTGFAGEENNFLYSARPDLSFKGILAASIIIAALGALMDTAISIASTINEIHETDNSLSIKALFKSGMNVGKDIIGTMSNTLILVYLGSSLPLVLLSTNIDLNKFFNLNQVATEILSALIGSIAILACVPITAIVAAYLIKKHKVEI